MHLLTEGVNSDPRPDVFVRDHHQHGLQSEADIRNPLAGGAAGRARRTPAAWATAVRRAPPGQ